MTEIFSWVPVSGSDAFGVFLPPVPNLIGVILWAFETCIFKWRLTLDGFPALLCDLPPRLLPPLSGEIPEDEAARRLRYWGAWLLLSPFLMGLLCEACRVFSIGAKHLWSCIEHSLAQRIGYNMVPEADAKTKPWVDTRDVSRVDATGNRTNVGFKLQMVVYHSFCASLVGVAVTKDWLSVGGGGMAWELWAVWQQVCLWTLFLENLVRCVCFPTEALGSSTFKVVCLYTVPLLSEVTDTMKDWVMTGVCVLATQSSAGLVTGAIMILGDVLLAYGAHTLHVGIKITGSIGMICPPVVALQALAFTAITLIYCLHVLLGTATMVAFVLGWAGVFLLISVVALLALGGGLVFKGIAFLCCLPLLFLIVIQITGEVGCVGALLVLLAAALLIYGLGKVPVSEHLLALGGFLNPQLEKMQVLLGRVWATRGFGPWLFQQWILLVTDAGCLAVVSSYTIVYSYWLVTHFPETCNELKRSYRPIISLRKPTELPPTTYGITFFGWLSTKCSNMFAGLCVDFLSSARFLIAVGEDWPQGLLGAIISYRYGHGLGFAGVSAVWSFLKGILIAIGQLVIYSNRSQAVEWAIANMPEIFASRIFMDGKQKPRPLSEVEQQLTDMFLTCDVIGEEVFAGLHLRRGVELFDSLFERLDNWIKDMKSTGVGDKTFKDLVIVSLLRRYMEQDVPIKSIKDLGFSRQSYLQVYTMPDFLKEGIVQTPADAEKEGFTISLDIEKAGTVLKDRFTRNDLQEYGCTLEQYLESGCSMTARNAREGGFSAEECYAAGLVLTVEDCCNAGFSLKDIVRLYMGSVEDVLKACEEAGCQYSAKDFNQAGLAAKHCKEAGCSLKDCQDHGYSLQQCRRDGFSSKDFRDEGFSAKDCRQAGFSLKDIQQAGFGITEVYDQGQEHHEHSLAQCRQVGYSASDCRQAQFSVKDCLHAGFSLEDLLEAGFSEEAHSIVKSGLTASMCQQRGISMTFCREVGFSLHECSEAGYLPGDFKAAGYSAREFQKAGFSVRACLEAGFSLQHVRQSGFSLKACADQGFSVQQCRQAGYCATDCKKEGLSPKDCVEAGFSLLDCKEACFSLQDCHDHGFSLEQCRQSGGYSATDFKKGGFSVNDCVKAGLSLQEIREAKFTVKQCKQQGFSYEDCKEAGFSALDFSRSGYSALTCKRVGFSMKDCKQGKFTLEQCAEAGYQVVQECKLAGYSSSHCRNAGWSMEGCFEAGYTLLECREAGYTRYWSVLEYSKAGGSLSDCIAAGYSALHFRESGFSLQDCVLAGFSLFECKTAGYTAADFIEAGYSALAWHYARI
ncbi:dotG [Symbiodinium sp. CCMP2592]|nr:dotG [Symbiodinium sp. CCMP2592]